MQNPTLIPVVHLVMERDSKILMLRHRQSDVFPGLYGFPMGYVDVGESVADACVRATRLEAGVRIYVHDIHFAHVMRHYEPDNDRMEFFYEAREWKGATRNTSSSKYDELIWVDIDELPENTIPYIVDFVYHFKKGELFSEHGAIADPALKGE